MDKILKLLVIFAVFGCSEAGSLSHPCGLTISSANPIQFWLNGTESFNQKEVCSIEPVCFCQKFNCSDNIRIQFSETPYGNFVLKALSESGSTLATIPFNEYSLGLYEVEFTTEQYSICNEKIQFTIESTNEWASANATGANNWTGITYAAGVYIAVSSTGTVRIMRSTDGINWGNPTSVQSGIYSRKWHSVTYGAGLFIACAAEEGTDTNVAKIAYSSDLGLSWLHANIGGGTEDWNDIAYGAGLFVVVNSDASILAGNKFYTSPDGITWSAGLNTDKNGWNCIIYQNGLFVVGTGASTGNSQILTSTDGITFFTRAVIPTAQIFSIAYGNGTFVASLDDGTFRYSFDGITWSSSAGLGAIGWADMAFGNNTFVGVTTTGGSYQVGISNDGITWESVNPAAANNWNSIVYGDGIFVSVAGSGSSRVMYGEISEDALAFSDCIDIKTSHECTNLIEYTNSNDFAGLDYSSSSPSKTFFIRVESVFFEESFPEESESFDESNSQTVQLVVEVKRKKMLSVGYAPFYFHSKLKLVLSHDSVTIDDDSWGKWDGYDILPGNKRYPLRMAQTLLTDKNFVQRNVL